MRLVLTLAPRNEVMLDADALEMYLNAVREEVSNAIGVSSLTQSGSTLVVDIDCLTLKASKERLRPALTSTVMLHLRVVSLREA